MNQKLLWLFTANYLSELLKCPGCGGMCGDVGMCYPAASDLHDHKHVEHAEIGSDRHKEVASENDLSMERSTNAETDVHFQILDPWAGSV